jgi:hypothetical protein
MNGIQRVIKQNEILLDLVVNLKSEVEALRNVLIFNILDNKSESESERINSLYQESLKDSLNLISAQIKARYYLDGGPDDILKSAFPNE